MDRDDDSVIDFAKAKATIEGPSSLTVRRSRYCSHWHVWVDENARTVQCQDCEAMLDAFTVLLGYAHKERHFAYSRDELRKLGDKVDALTREERNIKARIRRAKARER